MQLSKHIKCTKITPYIRIKQSRIILVQNVLGECVMHACVCDLYKHRSVQKFPEVSLSITNLRNAITANTLCLLLLEIKCDLSKQGDTLSYLPQYKMTSGNSVSLSLPLLAFTIKLYMHTYMFPVTSIIILI